MGIENIGGINSILKNHGTSDWLKPTNSNSLKIEDINPFKDLNVEGVKKGENQSFSDLLTEKIANVNQLQVEANTAIEKLVSGKSKNIHETMLAVEKAEIAFKTMNQIRLKVIDAYKEIMRMQV